MTLCAFFLIQCKILRVLNLWQKNGVFSMDIIQPLLDMAAATMMPIVENGLPAAGIQNIYKRGSVLHSGVPL